MNRVALLAVPLVFTAHCVHAQSTNAPSSTPPGPRSFHDSRLGFLSPDEIAKLRATHDKVLTDNPKLKKEEDDLRVQASIAMGDGGTQDQQEALREAWIMHATHMREAMLAADPTVKPVIDKVDAHQSQLRAQQQQAMEQGGGSPTSTAK